MWVADMVRATPTAYKRGSLATASCLPHSLPGVRSSSTSPATASSGQATSLDNSWQLHVPCQ